MKSLIRVLIRFFVSEFNKATTVAAFARMTVQDSRKLLPAEYYPSWVVFSQRQKLSFTSLSHSLSASYHCAVDYGSDFENFLIAVNLA